MQLYRFSPIKSQEELLAAIGHIHESCQVLAEKVLGTALPVAGNIGVFCHYENEYDALTKLCDELVDRSDAMHGKYFRLLEPIAIPPATYTHLYIRKPDPYRAQVGDADFVMDAGKYQALKASIQNGTGPRGVRIFDRPGVDMLELFYPDVDALAYVVSA